MHVCPLGPLKSWKDRLGVAATRREKRGHTRAQGRGAEECAALRACSFGGSRSFFLSASWTLQQRGLPLVSLQGWTV